MSTDAQRGGQLKNTESLSATFMILNPIPLGIPYDRYCDWNHHKHPNAVVATTTF